MKTVSLELSKQLKEAGYPQESYMWWCAYFRSTGNDEVVDYRLVTEDKKGIPLGLQQPFYESTDKYIVSPTADEILDQLSKELIAKNYEGRICVSFFTEWKINYTHANSPFVHDKSLADAAAKMWLYLKKEGLL